MNEVILATNIKRDKSYLYFTQTSPEGFITLCRSPISKKNKSAIETATAKDKADSAIVKPTIKDAPLTANETATIKPAVETATETPTDKKRFEHII